jgi:hypothetical protein
MARELSPETERYLASVVAGGLFPSKEAALEAAVGALRAQQEHIPAVPAEHMDLVEQAMAAVQAGRCRELTDADWERLHQRARDVASCNPPSSDE